MSKTLNRPALDLFVDSVFNGPVLNPDTTPPGLLSAVEDGYSMPSELHVSKAWSVWRCFEPGSGREVAIKTPSLDCPLSTDEITSRMRAEFDFLSQLKSPRAVKGRGKKIDGQASYLAIEYAGDDDIAFFAVNRFRNDPSGFCELLLRAVRAVADLHKNGIVHGDLKPQHFVMNDGTPILIDFGLSANLQSPMRELNTPSCLAGTPGYIAPEVASGEATRHDARQDVYSLGVTLGRLVEAWAKNSGMKPRKSVSRIIRRCVQTDPADRYADADELMVDLSHATKPRRASAIATIAASVGVIATAGIGALLASAPSPAPTWTGQDQPDTPAFLDLDWTEGHITEGQARDLFLAEISQLPEEDQAAWEFGLLLHGRESHPSGESPFGDNPALSWRYHHPTRSLAWYSSDGQFYYRANTESPPVASPSSMILGIEFSANGKQAVLIDSDLDVYTADLFPDQPIALGKTPLTNARGAYRSEGLIYAMERITSVIHCWEQEVHTVRRHGYDVALQVHSNPGVVAYIGMNPADQRMVTVRTIRGEVLLPDTPLEKAGGIIECADYCAQQGLLCLGFDDGTAALYDARADRWRRIICPAEGDVSAVLLVPEEDRLFVASLGIHVFRLSDTQRTLTLGGRLVVNELVSRFVWEPTERAIYAESNLGVTRWHAAELD